jgi:hypothetical protein
MEAAPVFTVIRLLGRAAQPASLTHVFSLPVAGLIRGSWLGGDTVARGAGRGRDEWELGLRSKGGFLRNIPGRAPWFSFFNVFVFRVAELP